MEKQRIKTMLEILKKAVEGELSTRIELTEKQDELDQLAVSINELLGYTERNKKEQERSAEKLQQALDDAFWQNEELQARNEEFEQYAALLEQQKQQIESYSQDLAKSNQQLQQEMDERQRLQEEVIEPQRQAIEELSSPIISFQAAKYMSSAAAPTSTRKKRRSFIASVG